MKSHSEIDDDCVKDDVFTVVVISDYQGDGQHLVE